LRLFAYVEFFEKQPFFKGACSLVFNIERGSLRGCQVQEKEKR
jgi:hypothetical protein